MAKALQRLLAASSHQTQIFALDQLKSKLCYNGRKRDFEQTLYSAMLDLAYEEILNFPDCGEIYPNGDKKVMVKFNLEARKMGQA